jgi:hypothetical protein
MHAGPPSGIYLSVGVSKSLGRQPIEGPNLITEADGSLEPVNLKRRFDSTLAATLILLFFLFARFCGSQSARLDLIIFRPTARVALVATSGAIKLVRVTIDKFPIHLTWPKLTQVGAVWSSFPVPLTNLLHLGARIVNEWLNGDSECGPAEVQYVKKAKGETGPDA